MPMNTVTLIVHSSTQADEGFLEGKFLEGFLTEDLLVLRTCSGYLTVPAVERPLSTFLSIVV